MPLTPQQCRMARAALNIGVRDLAARADVSPNTIARLERGDKLHPRTLWHVQGALEANGVEFLFPDPKSPGGGYGVRLSAGNQLSRYGHLFNGLYDLPNLRTEPKGAYEALISIIAKWLDIIEGEGRQPDNWERLYLKYAISYLGEDQIHFAIAHIRSGITPPDNQGNSISHDEVSSVASFDLEHFQGRLRMLQGREYEGLPLLR